ncbi:AAA family ATPase [Laribacter hongkongensis]|uniref:AAA family ATPase n=1 Tax=Laribacter hongkongensis TaxID=168471 RepID=UPI001EFCAC62|nr:AAA family ATPase [Laribacter hongkongensis]MCG9059814.1 AAA family ATPase [Laribacter hongkongensis]MCG9084155.1 AAA family ATPase [Laribacter hongkongensis]MCG9086554.1 AAA family ATPase [Laribacter hongkongensis]
MATLLPDLSGNTRNSSGYRREIDVLEFLQKTLPDGYTIFHSVEWHSVHEGRDCHGEIDLIVINQAGDLLLVEVKAGVLHVFNGQLLKDYGTRQRDVSTQVRVQYGAMRQLLARAKLEASVTNCLVLPDFHLTASSIVGIPRERIYDIHDYPNLPARITHLLPLGLPNSTADEVKAFLSNQLDLQPDIASLQGQLQQTVKGLADGLATWVPRIQAPSRRYRIQATAGSGKTQLAIALLQEAKQTGVSALYVCFNRPLAEQMSRIAPEQCSTFHALCIDVYRKQHPVPDFQDPATFQQAEQHYLRELSKQQGNLDLLILDEAQDLQPEWLDGLITLLSPQGRLYLLEDTDQCLYGRPPYLLADAVEISSMDNFRSPQMVCRAINAFGLAKDTIKSKSPWRGELPDFYLYDGSEEDLLQKTEDAIQAQCAQGHDITNIAVLTTKGIQHSRLLRHDTLTGFSTRRYTGQFTEDGQAKWTKGLLLLDSVYRFKGQSASAVILTEIDFVELSRSECAKLFVGMTRGLLSVSLVLTHAAAQQLATSMQDAA